MQQTETVKSPTSNKSTLVHLEDVALGRPDRAWCGAKVRETLPNDVAIDCVVCAELARAEGYDV